MNLTPLEQLSARRLISDLREFYPVMFQERRVGRKHEVGMARSIRFELAVRKLPDSLFYHVFLFPFLARCMFVSSYEDSISEITVAANIRVKPKEGASREVILKMGHGYKLDRTPDGWVTKPLPGRAATFTEDLLSKRGWKFEVLVPFRAIE
jgi:hypothetical protein